MNKTMFSDFEVSYSVFDEESRMVRISVDTGGVLTITSDNRTVHLYDTEMYVKALKKVIKYLERREDE